MRRPYCPVCMGTIHTLDYPTVHPEEIRAYPCLHKLDKWTITNIQDFLDYRERNGEILDKDAAYIKRMVKRALGGI